MENMMIKKYYLFILTLACLVVGFTPGFFFGARHEKNKQEKQHFSLCEKGTDTYKDAIVALVVALEGCETAAAVVALELEETRWALGRCEYHVNKCVKIYKKYEKMLEKILNNKKEVN
jgi:hypothetical protein